MRTRDQHAANPYTLCSVRAPELYPDRRANHRALTWTRPRGTLFLCRLLIKMSVLKAMMAVVALVFFGTADAFVSPSAFAGRGSRSAGPRAAATARAAGAMRARPTMNVVDVRKHSSSCGQLVLCVKAFGVAGWVAFDIGLA